MTEWVYYKPWSQWVHPETFVRIHAEDTPWELKPEAHDD